MITTYDLDSCKIILRERVPDTQRGGAETAIHRQLPIPMLALQLVAMATREDRSPASHFPPAIPVRDFFRDR